MHAQAAADRLSLQSLHHQKSLHALTEAVSSPISSQPEHSALAALRESLASVRSASSAGSGAGTLSASPSSSSPTRSLACSTSSSSDAHAGLLVRQLEKPLAATQAGPGKLQLLVNELYAPTSVMQPSGNKIAADKLQKGKLDASTQQGPASSGAFGKQIAKCVVCSARAGHQRYALILPRIWCCPELCDCSPRSCCRHIRGHVVALMHENGECPAWITAQPS